MLGLDDNEEQWLKRAMALMKSSWIGSSPRSRTKKAVHSIDRLLAQARAVKMPQDAVDHYLSAYRVVAREAHDAESTGTELALEEVERDAIALADVLNSAVDNWTRYLQARGEAREYEKQLLVLTLDGKTYAGPLTTMLETAARRSHPYALAVGDLEQRKAVFKSQTELAKRDREAAILDARFALVYKDNVAQAKDALAQLATRPGASEERVALQALVDNGARAARPGNFKAAAEASAGAHRLLTLGLGKALLFEDNAGDDAFKEARANTATALRAFVELFELADKPAVESHRAAYTAILARVDPLPSSTALSRATDDMQALGDLLRREVSTLRRLKSEVDPLLEEVRRLMSGVTALATPDVSAPLHERYRLAQSLVGVRDYNEAKRTTTQLKADLTRLVDRLGPLHEAWVEAAERVEKEAVPTLQRYAEMGSEKFHALDIMVRPSSLVGRFTAARRQVAIDHDWPAACAVTTAIEDALKDPDGVLTVHVKALEDRAAAIRLAERAVQEAADRAAKAVAKLADSGVATADLHDSLVNARRGFFDLSEHGVLADPTLTTEKKRALAELDRVHRAATVLAQAEEDPTSAPNEAVGDLATRKLQAVCDKAIATAERELARTERLFAGLTRGERVLAGQAQRIAEGLARVKTAMAQEQAAPLALAPDSGPTRAEFYEARADELDVLFEEVGEFDTERQEKRGRLAEQIERDRTQLLSALKSVEKAHKDFKVYLATVRQEVDNVVAMSRSDVFAVLVQAGEAMASTGELGQLLARLARPDDWGAVSTKVDAIKDHLKSRDFKKVRPSLHAAQKKKFDKSLLPSLGEKPPWEAAVALESFCQELTTQRNDAASRKLLRDEIETQADEAAGLVKRLTDAPEYTKRCTAELKALRDFSENSEYDHKNRMGVLLATLRFVTSSEPGALDRLLELEKQTRQGQVDGEKRAADLQGRLDVFDANLKVKVEETKSTTPKEKLAKDRYDAVTAARSEAAKLLRKGQLDQCASKLDEAEQLARAFVANPLNSKAATEKKLTAARDTYKVAVHGLVRNLGALIDEILGLADEDDDVDGPAAVAPLRPLRTTFDPNKFDGCVDELLRDDISLPGTRLVREDGLRFVRVYRDRLDKDPVLRQLAEGAPFHATVPLQPLHDALTGMELNLLRAR